MRRRLKLILGPLIVLATIAAFTRYLMHHPGLLRELGDTSPLTIVVVLLLYAVWFWALALVLRFSLRMFHKPIGLIENFLLNAYSNLINFFGPGQSGPAVRGAYLKKRHGLHIKDYLFATLLYYVFYAIISAAFLLSGSLAWWQTALAIMLLGSGGFAGLRAVMRKKGIGRDHPGLVTAGWIGVATLLQAVAQVAIYFVELHSTHASVTLGQAATYTGAANFALFVALTPGAIGVRESFLLFTQRLHHINSADIVAANLIDRGVYLVFLGLLFVVVVSLHAKERLHFSHLKDE